MAEATLTQSQSPVEKLAAEMRGISQADQERIEALRHSWIAAGRSEEEATRRAVFLTHMMRDGLISTLPVPWTERPPSPPFTPIRVIGRPVSETLLEDREPH